MLTVKYIKDFGHPYMRECSVTHGLWTEVKEGVDYREEVANAVETSGIEICS